MYHGACWHRVTISRNSKNWGFSELGMRFKNDYKELKQRRRRRQRERQLKMYLRVSAIVSQLLLAKCVLSILELNWNQRFRAKKIKLKIIVLTSSTQLQNREVIPRRRKDQNGYEMNKHEKYTKCKGNNGVFSPDVTTAMLVSVKQRNGGHVGIPN